MLRQGKEERNQMDFFCIDAFVPKDHLLRKIDETVDFEYIYEIVKDLYCPDNRRPSVDPVSLFKMVFFQLLYDIPSLLRTCEEINMNVAYRWFLGYLMNERIPHFSTVSHNFKHRFTEEIIDRMFEWILSEIEKHGYLSLEAVFVDGKHIKANANLHKQVKQVITKAAKEYEKQLMEEINADRIAHSKKPFDDDDQNSDSQTPKEKNVTQSTTNPESGVFHKGEHKKCFAYEAHTACDKFGYVMDVTEKFREKWNGKYPNILKSWDKNWAELTTFFEYPQEIRRIIYTTNAVEGYHRMVRKFTKSKSIFPTDDSIRKVIYLSASEISKKWNMPVRDWGMAYPQFMIYFEDRFAA